jgi:hypothetical protein
MRGESNYSDPAGPISYASRGLTAPLLGIILSGTNIIVTWHTNETGFILQSSTNLESPVWSSVSGQFTVTNSVMGSQQFFLVLSP